MTAARAAVWRFQSRSRDPLHCALGGGGAAAHAYAAAGTYRVSVSVSGPGGAAVSAAGTALVR